VAKAKGTTVSKGEHLEALVRFQKTYSIPLLMNPIAGITAQAGVKVKA
jgi:hypothetical protein